MRNLVRAASRLCWMAGAPWVLNAVVLGFFASVVAFAVLRANNWSEPSGLGDFLGGAGVGLALMLLVLNGRVMRSQNWERINWERIKQIELERDRAYDELAHRTHEAKACSHSCSECGEPLTVDEDMLEGIRRVTCWMSDGLRDTI